MGLRPDAGKMANGVDLMREDTTGTTECGHATRRIVVIHRRDHCTTWTTIENTRATTFLAASTIVDSIDHVEFRQSTARVRQSTSEIQVVRDVPKGHVAIVITLALRGGTARAHLAADARAT